MSDELEEYKPEPCAWCDGTKTMTTWVGTTSMDMNCTACRAKGVVLVLQPSQKCHACKGKGYYEDYVNDYNPAEGGIKGCQDCGGRGWANSRVIEPE
jgi:DnaJ-class molecular chaperone